MAKTKVTIYLSSDLLEQVELFGARQDRPLSWSIGHALRLALPTMLAAPSMVEVYDAGLVERYRNFKKATQPQPAESDSSRGPDV